jgi:predicted ester cyclase
MSTGDDDLIIKQYIEKVISTRMENKIEKFIFPDYAKVYNGRRYHLGIKVAAEYVGGVRQTYPDLRVTVEQHMAKGEWVANSIIARHLSGCYLGIKPTGKVLTFSESNVDKLVNGLNIENDSATCMLKPLLETGAIRSV